MRNDFSQLDLNRTALPLMGVSVGFARPIDALLTSLSPNVKSPSCNCIPVIDMLQQHVLQKSKLIVMIPLGATVAVARLSVWLSLNMVVVRREEPSRSRVICCWALSSCLQDSGQMISLTCKSDGGAQISRGGWRTSCYGD